MKLVIKLSTFFYIAVFAFGACKKEKTVTAPITINNQPPVARAGFDQTIILPTDSVELSGSGTDADGSIVGYSWNKISGPSFTIVNPNNAVTKIKNLLVGVYDFELKVTDNGGLTANDTVRVTIHSVGTNQLPVANAGADEAIMFPIDSTELSGSGTDPDGSIVSYSWSKISGPSSFTIVNPNNAVTKIKNLLVGVYEFEFKVMDNGGLTANDTVRVTIHPVGTNQPPVANAGADEAIMFPIDSTELSGSGTDPDGSIVSYSWSKISGPSSFTIVNPNNAVTKIKNLLVGVYEFELKVMDNGGLSATDKVLVTVLSPGTGILQLIPVGALSILRYDVATATVGNKILFAGGYTAAGQNINLYSRVDIYNMSTQTWSTTELSEARTAIGAVSVGNKILFAGGAKNFDYGNWDWDNLSTRIDIYDVSTNLWTTTELPDTMHFKWNWDGMTAAVAGNKAFFCGGDRRDIVHIYDVVTNSWSTAQLSVYRFDFASASVGNKILIAGGGPQPQKVDIYNMTTQIWTTADLSQGRRFIRAATLNNKAFFAGGRISAWQLSNKVDIYDNVTQSWSIATLSRETVFAGAAHLGQKMLFFGGSIVDIYNPSLLTWDIATISQNFSDGSSFIAAGGYVYATKGNQVWRIQF